MDQLYLFCAFLYLRLFTFGQYIWAIYFYNYKNHKTGKKYIKIKKWFVLNGRIMSHLFSSFLWIVQVFSNLALTFFFPRPIFSTSYHPLLILSCSRHMELLISPQSWLSTALNFHDCYSLCIDSCSFGVKPNLSFKTQLWRPPTSAELITHSLCAPPA